MSDERIRQLVFGFTVDSLVFAFHYFETQGFEPFIDEEAGTFDIRSSTGDDLDEEGRKALEPAVKYLHSSAPMATTALSLRGSPTETGVLVGGAIGEAYDRFQQERS